jgi:hypothetical protein
MNRSESRASWRHAVAALLILASTGCTSAGTGATDGDVPSGPTSSPAADPETPTESPTPRDPVLSPRAGEVIELDQHGPEYVFTKKGRYAVRLNPHLMYEVDSPDMWEVYRGRYFSTSGFSGGAGVFSVAGPVTQARLPAHPCRDRALRPVGATARDLADALTAQPVLKVTRPKPVSLNAGRGVYLEVRIPDRVNPATCQSGGVAVFSWKDSPPEWWELSAGNALYFWILDVDGQRMILAGFCETTCTDADLQTLVGMAASVTFVKEN